MLEFNGHDQKAQLICLHYANQLGNSTLIQIIEGKVPVTSEEEALALSRFFWQMVEASTEDRAVELVVSGEIDLQYWTRRSMIIISNYLINEGFQEQWENVFDEA